MCVLSYRIFQRLSFFSSIFGSLFLCGFQSNHSTTMSVCSTYRHDVGCMQFRTPPSDCRENHENGKRRRHLLPDCAVLAFRALFADLVMRRNNPNLAPPRILTPNPSQSNPRTVSVIPMSPHLSVWHVGLSPLRRPCGCTAKSVLFT